jgi:diguanylate cyclase (GGDEF)-like protein
MVQVLFSALYVSGVISGFIDVRVLPASVAVAVVSSYQLAYATYVVGVRLRERRIRWVERSLPGAILTTLAFAWISTGDLASPIWVVLPVFVIAQAGRIPLVRRRYFIPYMVFAVMGSTMLIGASSPEPFSWSTAFVIWGIAAGVAVTALTTLKQLTAADDRARSVAETDALTGVANRRRFFRQLEALDAQERNDPFAIIMMDLDNFKRLNDAHGHLHGDETLAATAHIAQACLREGDLLARYGGEEFVAILYRADAHAALTVAERIRSSIAAETPTRVSIGVATSGGGHDAPAVLRLADQQLLIAKRSGKNMVRMRPGLTSAA